MSRRILLACVVSLVTGGASRAVAAGWFASPSGQPAALGSRERPLDLVTALSETSPARPGDTVWLLGGTYAGAFTSHLTGAPGERAILDGTGAPANTLTVRGAHAWYWGFEVTNSDPTRVYRTKVNVDDPASPDRVRGVGVNVFGPETKFINLVIHDALGGFGLWRSAVNAEVCGCLTYNNGVIDPARGHGHGLHIQNHEGTKLVREVISFNNHATGMKGYSEEGFVEGIHFEGVCSFNNGWARLDGDRLEKMSNLLVGTSDHPADGIAVVDCHLYHGPKVLATNLQLGHQNPANRSATVTGNRVIGGSVALSLKHWQRATVTGNVFRAETSNNTASDQSLAHASPAAGAPAKGFEWDDNTYFDTTTQRYPFQFPGGANQFGGGNLSFDDWRRATGFDVRSRYTTDAPTGTDVFVRPNQYERGRAHVIVYNWDGKPAVTADLADSGLKDGQEFEVFDAQDFFGKPVATGTYKKNIAVVIPMTPLTHAAPVGDVLFAPQHTGPEFGVFVILPVAAGR